MRTLKIWASRVSAHEKEIKAQHGKCAQKKLIEHSRVSGKRNPYTADTSSPDVSLGNALILVPAFRYELGASCPKFSAQQEVRAYRCENRYFAYNYRNLHA